MYVPSSVRVTEPESNRYLNILDTSHILSHASVNHLLHRGGGLRSALRMTHGGGKRREKTSVAKVSGQQPERILHGTEFLLFVCRLAVE